MNRSHIALLALGFASAGLATAVAVRRGPQQQQPRVIVYKSPT